MDWKEFREEVWELIISAGLIGFFVFAAYGLYRFYLWIK